jgi:hypothetical protein
VSPQGFKQRPIELITRLARVQAVESAFPVVKLVTDGSRAVV